MRQITCPECGEEIEPTESEADVPELEPNESGGYDVSQIELFAGICGVLTSLGAKRVNQRQSNAIIEAANLIVDALAKGHQRATPGMGLEAWLDSDDTGASSLFMAYVTKAKGGPIFQNGIPDNEHPHDSDDFGRCYRLLKAVPEAAGKLHKVALQGPIWKALIDHWGELTELYEADMPADPKEQEKGWTARRLHDRMKELIDAARDDKT